MKNNTTKSKICTKCGIEKPLSNFPTGCKRNNRVYHKSYCKVCDAKKQRKYYQKNKEHCKKQHREYYKKNRKALLIKERKRYHTDSLRKLKCSLSRIKRETNCSLDELVKFYTTQLIKQKHCCAICGIHLSKLSTRFHIDHNHNKTGYKSLRGLLCCHCNSGIGNLRDSSKLCLKAFQYLKCF